MIWAYRTIVAKASSRTAAKALAAAASISGVGMFIRELATTSAGPATHYISSGAIEPAFADMLADTNGTLLFAASQQTGLPYTLTQCKAAIAALTIVDLTGETALETMTRLGLVFVEKPL